MTETRVDPKMIEVWMCMAGHFLDNESRPDLPLTALCCIEAGLSAAQAGEVWRYDVVPAVGANLNSFAGEWAGWNRDWLVERILQVRASWWNRPGPGRKFHLPLFHTRRECLALERCIELLHSIRDPAARERLARDLSALAELMVNYRRVDAPSLNPEDRERLCQLYPAPFKTVMWPSLHFAEVAKAERSMQRGLFGGAR